MKDSLVPRPPLFAFTIIHGSTDEKRGRPGRIHHMNNVGGCEVDVRREGPHCKTTHWIIRSSALSQFWESKHYRDRKYSPPARNSLSRHAYCMLAPPPYVHLASAHLMNAPRPSLSFTSRVYCECKRGRPGNEAKWRMKRAQYNPSVEDLSLMSTSLGV